MCSGDISNGRTGVERPPRGILLGFAQLSKFSMLLLYAIWPFFWLAHLVVVRPRPGAGGERAADDRPWPRPRHRYRGVEHPHDRRGLLLRGGRHPPGGVRVRLADAHAAGAARDVAASQRERAPRSDLAVPGQPLPRYLAGRPADAVAGALSPGLRRAENRDGGDPSPLLRGHPTPEGSTRSGDRRRPTATGRRVTPSTSIGELRDTGWRLYYPLALLYKVPEGTWLLVALSLVVLVAVKRSAAGWFDELMLWTLPVVILISMSVLTDINLGLRYVLAILPYVFISTGKVVPWCLKLREPWRRAAGSFIVGSLALTIAASAWIYPQLSLVLQLGLGRPGSRAAAPDRQQPRLGPGPGRAAAVVEGKHPRSADRAGVFRADQPLDLRAAGRALQVVPSAGPARDGVPDAGDAEPPADRPGPQADARLLRGERDLALWPAVAALRPGPAAHRPRGRRSRTGIREERPDLFPAVPARSCRRSATRSTSIT